MLDIREMIRRFRAGDADRRIARDLGASRKTVGKYREWAAAQDLLRGPLPDPATLQGRLATTLPMAVPPVTPSKVAVHHDRVVELRQRGVECRAIYARLCEERGFGGSYASVYRYVRRLEPRTPDACVRVETPPAEEAQVDFGYAGRLRDPRTGEPRKTWAFVMTLSFSRHCYVEFVFDQTVDTWLRCHRHAFEWFTGIVRRVVIDNLKAAITHALVYDPIVQRAYRECAEHYGFLISPCRPRTPEHKGKVEQGGVHYVLRNFVAGREFADLSDANQRVRTWCRETAGQRIHGTTKEQPWVRFTTVEQMLLLPLPPTPYAVARWKQAKLHRDCHVIFDGAFYSAPHRLIGQTLWVRAAETSVTVFQGYEIVAVHPRAAQPGQRFTVTDHLPPTKVEGLLTTPALCLCTRGRDRARHQRRHWAGARGPAARSAADRRRHLAVGAQIRAATRRRGVSARPRLRGSRLRDDQADPRARIGPAAGARRGCRPGRRGGGAAVRATVDGFLSGDRRRSCSMIISSVPS